MFFWVGVQAMGGAPSSQAAGAVLGQGYALAPSSTGQPPLQFSAPPPASRPDAAGAGFVMSAHAGGGVQLPFGGRMFSQVQAAAQAAAQQQPAARCAVKGQRELVDLGYRANAARCAVPGSTCFACAHYCLSCRGSYFHLNLPF